MRIKSGILILSGTFSPFTARFIARTERIMTGMLTITSTIYGKYHGIRIVSFKKFGAAEPDELNDTANAVTGAMSVYDTHRNIQQIIIKIFFFFIVKPLFFCSTSAFEP